MVPTTTDETAMRVLLVEDNDDDRYLANRVLTRKAHAEVVSARDGQEALELLERDAAFDLILLDINMPRLTGLEMLERWAVGGRPVPPVVVMLTSSEHERDRAEAGRFECVRAYVTKPISKDVARRLQAIVRAG